LFIIYVGAADKTFARHFKSPIWPHGSTMHMLQEGIFNIYVDTTQT